MGFEACFLSAGGSYVFPRAPADWAAWVSAGRTRNHLLDDPLLDWLNLYGREAGFRRDDELPGYDARCDFMPLLFGLGTRFEAAVVAHLRGLTSVVSVARGWEDIRDLEKARETLALMQAGTPVIHQGVLLDAQTRTYGAPDLLVRADELARLFPGSLSPDELQAVAPDLGGPWHYRVVDIKFSTLHLTATGRLGNGGSAKAYRAQVYVYNRALGPLQGYTPPAAYLLGRGWEQTTLGVKNRGAGCMERLGPVDCSDPGLVRSVDEAIAWVRRVRADGGSWSLLPRPSVPELWPNMGNQQDGPWHAAKREIGHALGELTSLWRVGVRGRRLGHAAGVYDWRDPACVPQAMGATGDVVQPTLSALLDVNRSSGGPPVRPAFVSAARDVWKPVPPVEFYVDFETVSDVNDDMSRIPERGGQPLIFMIGCGHMEGGEWRFRCFTASSLSEPAEAGIIDGWLAHMDAAAARSGFEGAPRVFHWSHAETSTLETAYNSAVARHPERAWPMLNWFDLLAKVFRAEPVVVRDALGFGLKQVARAFRDHGFIQSAWEDGPVDGLGAMVGAWWCAEEAAAADCRLEEIPLMGDIARYNEVDCRVMMELLRRLREHH